jgi:hypothetical protein
MESEFHAISKDQNGSKVLMILLHELRGNEEWRLMIKILSSNISKYFDNKNTTSVLGYILKSLPQDEFDS